MWAQRREQTYFKKRGFTIVELLIVIIVIAILAAIVIVTYTGMQSRARTASLQSDLVNAAKKLAMDNANNGTYPATLAAANGGQGIVASSGNTFQYGTTGSSYCLSEVNGNIAYTVTDVTPNPYQGSCGGLLGAYYSNMTLTAPSTIQQVDSTINFNWNGAAPASGVPGTNFSVQWSGYITAPTTGTYTFTVTSDDGERLYVNGTLLVDKWVDQGATPWSGTIALTAGQKVPITYQMYQHLGGSTAVLQWTPPGGSQAVIPSTALSPN